MKIKVRIQYVADSRKREAMVYMSRDRASDPLKSNAFEVLAQNGKWREKQEFDAIFEDEKFEVYEGESSIKKVQELKSEISQLKEEKETLVFKKNMEEKEIAHLVKMKEEKIIIKTEQERLKLTQQFQEKEMALQKDYFDKVMKAVQDGQKKMEDIYSKILERLPNINMEIKRGNK